MSDLVVVIPARGGSQRIRGKNIRPLAGKPLVHHAIEYALELEPRTIIVSTDSEEVAGVVRTRYPDVKIDFTFAHTDTTTVDMVTKWYYDKFPYLSENTLVVIQPTMIGDVVRNVKNVLAELEKYGDDWIRCSGLRAARRQFHSWGRTSETGTLIDIDTMSDFAAAETLLRKSTTIGIYYKAGEKQGWGHEKRARTLADALQDYDVECISWHDHATISGPTHRLWKNIQIIDVGDTTETEMLWRTRGSKVITIEDNGPGARLAHASINPFTDLKYAVLRPEFYNLPEYVVRDAPGIAWWSFGGQDNHGTGELVAEALNIHGHNIMPDTTMAADMLKADVFLCAGGQTSVEAIKVGVPTIVIPALPTEAMRPHLSPVNGIINLGISPTKEQIRETVYKVLGDKMLREDMSRRMKAVRVGDGAVEIRRIVEDLCQR